MTTILIYILLVLGIALVVVGLFVVARQLLVPGSSRPIAAGASASYLSALVIVIGIASLGISGLLSIKKPVSTVVVQEQTSTVTASPAAASTTASPAAASTTPAAKSTASTSPVPTGAVILSAPASGSKVQHCDVFTGTSNLPASDTIVLGVQDLDDGDKTTYLEAVNNWDKPADLAQWTGFQYFGSGDASVGQRYMVSVIVINAITVKSALAQPANHTTWAVTSLPTGSTVKQTLDLTRISGQGPGACN